MHSLLADLLCKINRRRNFFFSCRRVLVYIYSRRSCHTETKKERLWKACDVTVKATIREVTMHWPRLTRFPQRWAPCHRPPLLRLNPAPPSPSGPSICTSPRCEVKCGDRPGWCVSTALSILISLRHANKSCLLDWEAVFPDDQYSGKDCCHGDQDHRCNNPRVQPKPGLRRQMNSIRSNSGVVKEPINLTAQIHDVWLW